MLAARLSEDSDRQRISFPEGYPHQQKACDDKGVNTTSVVRKVELTEQGFMARNRGGRETRIVYTFDTDHDAPSGPVDDSVIHHSPDTRRIPQLP